MDTIRRLTPPLKLIALGLLILATGIAPMAVAQPAAADTQQLLDSGQAIAAAAATGDRAAMLLAVAGLLAVVFRVAIALLVRVAEWAPQQRRWIPWATMGLGLVLAIATKLAAGIPWWQALIVAGSGPGAVLVDQLLKALKPPDPAAAGAASPQVTP